MSLKMLREVLCREQTVPRSDDWPSDIASEVSLLINMIDRYRPVGSDGNSEKICTCGFGGFHDDINPRCEIAEVVPTEKAPMRTFNRFCAHCIVWGDHQTDQCFGPLPSTRENRL